MTGRQRLDAVLEVIAAEARRRPDFLRSLERALELSPIQGRVSSEGTRTRPHRRSPAALDPFRVLREGGSDALRAQLGELSVEQLRDVVAQYRVEPYALAMKWKKASRLIDLITETLEQRARKGDAFRGAPAGAEDNAGASPGFDAASQQREHV